MEGGSGGPYEEQLLDVFNSCLEKGETKLRAEGLRALCEKLQLDERSDKLISHLSNSKETFVTFETFRDGLLKILDQTHGDSQCFNAKDQAHDRSLESRNTGAGCAKFGHKFQGQSPENSPARLNGLMNGEIDHSEMCGLSGIGYASVPKEMLEQIFEKLDMDCDGMISFDEFILLFENDKNAHEQLTMDWGNGTSSDVIKSRDSQNVVHILGPHQTGYARMSTIVSMWEVAGITDAANLLSDLGFTSTEIRLTDLTTVLCEELKNLRDEPDNAVTSTHMSLLKGALTLYQEEVRCMNTLVEHLSGERDKLRIDVAEANERANLLAQEIDEHHVRLEKSRQDQLKQLEQRHAEITRDLSFQCTSEREAHTAALKALDRQLQVVQHEEQQVRTKLANVLQENQTLENDVETLNDQITKLKSSNAQLLAQVQSLAAEHEEIDTSDDCRESEQIILLVERIKRLQADIALLRDQNDELTTELEFTKSRNNEMKNLDDLVSVSSVGTDPLEITDNENGKKSRVTNGWGNMHELEDAKRSKLRETIRGIIAKCKELAQCNSCASRFANSGVVAALESILSEISTIERLPDEIDAGRLERVDEVEVECEERTSESLRDLVVGQAEKSKKQRVSHIDELANNIDKNFNNLDGKCGSKNKISSLRDYPPRKEEGVGLEAAKSDKDRGNICSNVALTLSDDCENDIRERLNVIIQEQESKHNVEKKQLSERCAELERSLDLLTNEYEQCEDYWAAKLEEERQLFEQEQKISDEKFAELIAKMAEYEEQFSPGDKSRDGRLSPIEERFNLEQQYTDLEDEYEELKTQMDELLVLRDNEIKELQERFSSEDGKSKTSIDASTQYSLDETDHESIPIFSTTSALPVVLETTTTTTTGTTTTTHSSNDSHSCSQIATISQSSAMKKFPHCTTSCNKVPDPIRFNSISENAVSNNSLYSIPSPKIRDCYCQQIEAYNSMEELCRVHKAELHRLYQKKLEIDNECMNLTKQKETLIKGVSELKNFTTINRLRSAEDTEESTCSMSINVLKALNERLQVQEKKRRNLKISLSHQQQQAERILQQTWQQHCQEVAALRFALQSTKEQLKKQVQTNQEQAERLAKADILSTDLYVQNAHLMASIKRLEQHCHILAQFGGESTSV